MTFDEILIQVLDLLQRQKRFSHPALKLRFNIGDIAAWREPQDSASAETHYRQALTLAEQLGMRPLAAHCHRGLSSLYATIGRRAEARTELSAAIGLYRAMDMTFWLPQAEATLAQLAEA